MKTIVTKALSKTYLYVGLVLMAIGFILVYKKKNVIGYILIFAGFIISIFWFSNRHSTLDTIDSNGNILSSVIVK